MADGTITFETKLNTTGVAESLKSLRKELADVQKKYNQAEKKLIGLQPKLKANPLDANLKAQADGLAKVMDSAYSKIEDLQGRIANLEPLEGDSVQADKTTGKLNSMYEKYQKLMNMGENPNSKSMQKLQYDIEQAEKQLDSLYSKMNTKSPNIATDLQGGLKQVTEGHKQLSDAYLKAYNSSSLLQKGMDGIKNASKRLGKSIFSLGNMFKLLALRMAMRAVIEALKTGLTNLSQYSEETRLALSGLKNSLGFVANSFATAFAPLLSIVAPVLTRIIDLVGQAMNALAKLFAMLGNKKSYVVAVKQNNDLGKSIAGAGKSAKKAGEEEKRALGSFDEINQLNLSKEEDSGGGGGSGTDVSGMFETLPLTESLYGKLQEIKGLISDGFWAGFTDDWQSMVAEIQADAKSIQETLSEIFNSPIVQSAMQHLYQSFFYNIGMLSGAFATVGLTLGQLLVGGIESSLTQSQGFLVVAFSQLFNGLAEQLDWIGLAAVVTADILTVFGSQFAQNILGDIFSVVGGAFLTAGTLLVDVINSMLQLVITPFADNAGLIKTILLDLLSGIDAVLTPVTNTILGIFEWLLTAYDTYVKPFVDQMSQGISNVFGNLLQTALTTVIPSILTYLTELGTAWTTWVQPIIDDLLNTLGPVLGTLFEAIMMLWNMALAPLIEFIGGVVMTVLGYLIDIIGAQLINVLKGLATTFGIVFKGIMVIIDGVLKAFMGLIQFITGVFTGNWKQAWEGVKNIFRSVWNTIARVCETVINGIVDALNKISIDIPDWVPFAGGKNLGFHLDHVSIPKLATGTVVPPNAGEFMAILGDNKSDTEVVSPLETMKQAMIEAMRESGGGNVNIVLKFDGDLAELARILKPELESEDRRVGVRLVEVV